MFRVSVMYPNQEGVKFDIFYYRTKHMELVKNLLKPFGLIKTEVDRGVSGGGNLSAPYVCVGHLYFDSRDGYDGEWPRTGRSSGAIYLILPTPPRFARSARYSIDQRKAPLA